MQVAVTWSREHHGTLTDFLNKLVENDRIIESVTPATHKVIKGETSLEAAIIVHNSGSKLLTY